mgnify:CR=1 FL=1
MDYILTFGGFVLLFIGGESLVRGAVGLAQRLGVSTLFIGVVVVGFGTSAPEFLVCLEAALSGHDDVTIGNVVGSNIVNLMLILGTAAMIQPVINRPATLRRDGMAMLLSSALLVGLAFTGHIDRWVGLAMLATLAGFLAYSVQCERNSKATAAYEEELEDVGPAPGNPWLALLAVAMGVGALVAGANMLVDGATGIARAAGVPDAVIAVTLVALGTSLPELATVLVAALRKHADVALGSVLGSNVFNVLGMLGMTALIEPVGISPAFLNLDMWVMLGVTMLVMVFLTTGQKLSRQESGLLLVGYAGYMGYLLGGGGAVV